MNTKSCTDVELKAMRDAVYPSIPGCYQTYDRWEQVIKAWRRDEEWLTSEYNKLKTCEPRRGKPFGDPDDSQAGGSCT